jgi:hypothetical protein
MGRPKGTRNRKVLVREFLLESIAAREGNTVKKMSKLEAILTQTINDALKGDHKARLVAIGMAREDGLLTPEQVEAVEGGIAERLAAAIARMDGNKREDRSPDGEIRLHRQPPRSGHARQTAHKGKREMNSNMKTRPVSSSGPSAAPGPTEQEFAELRCQLAALTGEYNELKQGIFLREQGIRPRT